MTGLPSRLSSAVGALLVLAGTAVGQAWPPVSPFPTWGAVPPQQTTTLLYDPSQSAQANGALLHAAIGALVAGQGLAVGPGTWSIGNRLDLHGMGTAQAPIRLFAANPAQRPIITRPDASQNAINVGSNAPARFWILQDLEITGGSDLLRLYDAASIWIDRCYLHDGQGVGLAAATMANDHLYVTRNEIARPGPGTNGEGMYLGSNGGAFAVTWSVIAYNHVHDTRSAVPGQGDGIELKQGSHHNWLLGNHVHDCRNPCILVYGTGGTGENLVDGNLCYDSDDVVLQVQGEATVRNNLALGGTCAFGSHDHQGQSRDCRVVHNTFVSSGGAAAMQAWSGRPNMVFANNAVYSLGGESLHFGNGSAGVLMAGNVVLGPTFQANGGYTNGLGLADFVDLSLAPLHVDARPVLGGALDNRGVPTFAEPVDVAGAARLLPADPGAVGNAATFSSPIANLPIATGGVQALQFAAPSLAGKAYQVLGSLSGTLPGTPLPPFTLPLQVDFWTVVTLQQPNTPTLQGTAGVLDANGAMQAAVAVPPLPASLHGLSLDHVLVALQGTAVAFVSNPVHLVLP